LPNEDKDEGTIMARAEPELIYVYLPESLGPIDRGDRYEEPIIEELERLGLGEVSGGGSSLGDPLPDGTRQIEFCGIDVDTDQVDATRDALRTLLPKLGCPAGTQLHYRADDRPLQDEYDGSGWELGRQRSMLHPGFGI
jgi:hypothetical protein